MSKLTLGLRGLIIEPLWPYSITIQARLLSDLLKLTLGKEAFNFLGPPNVETIVVGAISEWSKALLVRENKRKIKKIPGSPTPGLGNL